MGRHAAHLGLEGRGGVAVEVGSAGGHCRFGWGRNALRCGDIVEAVVGIRVVRIRVGAPSRNARGRRRGGHLLTNGRGRQYRPDVAAGLASEAIVAHNGGRRTLVPPMNRLLGLLLPLRAASPLLRLLQHSLGIPAPFLPQVDLLQAPSEPRLALLLRHLRLLRQFQRERRVLLGRGGFGPLEIQLTLQPRKLVARTLVVRFELGVQRVKFVVRAIVIALELGDLVDGGGQLVRGRGQLGAYPFQLQRERQHVLGVGGLDAGGGGGRLTAGRRGGGHRVLGRRGCLGDR
mmetsp:Transcript_1237/g.3080  ORF Transcript_1237/g.3080 Transcript_1237/m.3080 type:complete len:289 (+) Transcript_1237:571-1437(+)